MTNAERDWLKKYHAALSACLWGRDVEAIERKHEATLKRIGLPATEITLAHALRVAGKSSPAAADETFRKVTAP